jgi:phage replication-related protein YjqB (UPF0714/DUF867 family)
MVADTYRSFAELQAAERDGVDYRIVVLDRGSPISIIAPHGGYIEPPTSKIAALVAADTFNLYCFEDLRIGRQHHELHITSHNFDEPKCCALVAASDIVVALHGRLDRDEPRCVYVGGLDEELRRSVARKLRSAGFEARANDHIFPATGAENICNRGRRGKGIQLELPRTLRDYLAADASTMARFAGVLRGTLG